MNVLIIDMTHGGTVIASEFLNHDHFNVFAMDIYKTVSEKKKKHMAQKGIKFVQKEFLEGENIEDDLLIVSPIHCKLNARKHLTHHEAVELLMKDKIKVPLIEITGVKGKTSVSWMLKEIFTSNDPLILSSLGIEVIKNKNAQILKDDISITPASIITAWKLGEDFKPGICIFETSLGGTGLADVGIITNIAENYQVASGKKNASLAKAQMFKSKITVCDFKSFTTYYSDIDAKINTFGLNDKANVFAYNIKYGLNKTIFKAKINDLMIDNGDILNIEFNIQTFAPAEHHLNNVLCAICAALSLNTPINQIKEGLENFRGIKGRTSIRKYKESTIIEEINPGLNVTAVKKSVAIIKDFKNSTLIFGGQYGITCEEIDEDSTLEFLNHLDNKISLLMVDELGKNIKDKIKREYKYFDDFNDAIEDAVYMNSKMILLIYRSIFSDQGKR